MEKRLDGWKRDFLSKREGLTLVQSDLSASPTYHISVLKNPIEVVEDLK